MRRKVAYLLASVLVGAALLGTAAACTGGGGIVYPDYPLTTDKTKESWEQGEKSDLTIDWYVDRSTFVWAGADGSAISDLIYQKTGIKIRFQTPLNDDGQMLNTILNSGNMPDLITLDGTNTTRVQMQEEGYAYPIGGLAERWAPGLLDNFEDEIKWVYAASDGEFYGIPSLYYSEEGIKAFEEQGQILQSNAAFIARKDYLDWYVQNHPEADPTTPDGFIEMCKTVRDHYNLRYTIAPDAFTTTADNSAIYRLAQYFAVPRENEDGTLTYLEAEEGFYDCLAFLNRCYREGLIDESNFSNTKNQQGNILQNGKCFVFMAVPQDYGGQIKEFVRTSNTEYVGIVLRNKNGDAPVMANLASWGDMFTMVTKDCERPDRVIKLIDYLTSNEGQMTLFYGIEGEHWDYDIRPGETVTGEDGVARTYRYGRVQWKPETFEMIFDKRYSELGILAFQLMCVNKAQKKLATFSGDEMYNWATYLVYNCKTVLSDYTYTPKYLSVGRIRDASQPNYLEITTKATLLSQLWRERVTQIITADTEEDCRAQYESALARAEAYGYKDVLAFDNVTFQRVKSYFGLEHAWAPLMEGYDPPPVTSIYGNTDYCVEIPDFIPRV